MTLDERNRGAEPVPAQNFREFLRGMGPGLVVAFMWLGTGDLIDSSVAGASYGYALLWSLVLALLCRYAYVSAISKYVLCNNAGDDAIMPGFARLWRGFPLVLSAAGFILCMVYESYLIKGAAVSIYQMTGQLGDRSVMTFVWAVVVASLGILMVLSSRQYKLMEHLARVAAVVLIGTFFYALFAQGFQPLDLLEGLAFGIPDNKGSFGAMLVVVALIGGVGGSIANLLYPYFMRDKGWRGPEFRTMQRYDLLTGIASIVVINLAVWVVAAEALGGTADTIDDEFGLATMMETAVGPVGPPLLWIGLFFVTFTGVASHAAGFGKLLVDGLQAAIPARKRQYTRLESDPIYKPVMVVMLVVPLVFSLPFAPNIVVLTVIGSSLAVLVGPIIITGVVMLTTSKKYMLAGFVNKWWETLGLVAIGCVGLWAIYHLIVSLIARF